MVMEIKTSIFICNVLLMINFSRNERFYHIITTTTYYYVIIIDIKVLHYYSLVLLRWVNIISILYCHVSVANHYVVRYLHGKKVALVAWTTRLRRFCFYRSSASADRDSVDGDGVSKSAEFHSQRNIARNRNCTQEFCLVYLISIIFCCASFLVLSGWCSLVRLNFKNNPTHKLQLVTLFSVISNFQTNSVNCISNKKI